MFFKHLLKKVNKNSRVREHFFQKSINDEYCKIFPFKIILLMC